MRTLISSFGAVCNYLSEKSKRIYKKNKENSFSFDHRVTSKIVSTSKFFLH